MRLLPRLSACCCARSGTRRFIGQIVVGLVGMGWTLATCLVVPVLAARDVGPYEAVVERPAVQKTWGESVIGQAGLSLAFGLIYLGVAICGLILVFMAVALHNVPVIVMTGSSRWARCC
jgi:hypothetical protein